MYTYRAFNQRLNKVDHLQEEASSIVSVGLVNSVIYLDWRGVDLKSNLLHVLNI